MKLILEQREETEIEVIIKYHEMDMNVKRLVQKIKSCEHTIYGIEAGKQFSKIHTHDIYYIESVDKKTFIYTKDQVFRTDKKLYHFLEELKDEDFVQVSKSCILNLDVLKQIKTLYNSRMEATLINGEKITVSRTYIPAIKQALSRGSKNE